MTEHDSEQYDFLKFHETINQRIKKLNIPTQFIKQLIEEKKVMYNPHAPILELEITSEGYKFMQEFEKKNKVRFPIFIGGKTQETLSSQQDIEINDEIVYRFLKFHLGVIRRTKVPYLRELVAEDYLMDMEHLPFRQTNHLISRLVEEGILEYDQFGAFPGTGVTSKGKEYFVELKQKLKIAEDESNDDNSE